MEHPKCDQNPKSTPLDETTSTPLLSYASPTPTSHPPELNESFRGPMAKMSVVAKMTLKLDLNPLPG